MPKMTREALSRSTGISRHDLETIGLLEKATQPDALGQRHQLTAPEKEQVVSFLEGTIGNVAFNKQLQQLDNCTPAETGIGAAAIRTLESFIFKSRHWKAIPEVNRVEQLLEQDKITPPQFGALHDLRSSTRELRVFASAGLIDDRSRLSDLHGDVKKIEQVDDGALRQHFFKEELLPAEAVVADQATKEALMSTLATLKMKERLHDRPDEDVQDDNKPKGP